MVATIRCTDALRPDGGKKSSMFFKHALLVPPAPVACRGFDCALPPAYKRHGDSLREARGRAPRVRMSPSPYEQSWA